MTKRKRGMRGHMPRRGLLPGMALIALLGLTLLTVHAGGGVVQAGLSQAQAPPGGSPVASEVRASATLDHAVFLPSIAQVHPCLSPSGLIAFERHYCTDPPLNKNCSPHDIWVRSHDGSGVEINLTNTPDLDEGVPTWSPDGRFLAYTAGPLGSRAIYKMDLCTREVTALTSGTYDESWPAWSPLGDKIAFMRLTPGEQDDVYLMNPDGTGVAKLTNWLYGDRFPAWSRDGQWIAFSSDRFYAGQDLYVVRPNDPASVKIVLQTNRPGIDDRRDEIYPSWSPDGSIYHNFVYKDAPADAFDYLYRVRPDGSDRQLVFDDGYQRYIPSFSPDGQCFVFYSKMGGVDKEVWKWCNGYSAAVNLTNNADHVGDEYCAWSPVP